MEGASSAPLLWEASPPDASPRSLTVSRPSLGARGFRTELPDPRRVCPAVGAWPGEGSVSAAGGDGRERETTGGFLGREGGASTRTSVTGPGRYRSLKGRL